MSNTNSFNNDEPRFTLAFKNPNAKMKGTEIPSNDAIWALFESNNNNELMLDDSGDSWTVWMHNSTWAWVKIFILNNKLNNKLVVKLVDKL